MCDTAESKHTVVESEIAPFGEQIRDGQGQHQHSEPRGAESPGDDDLVDDRQHEREPTADECHHGAAGDPLGFLAAEGVFLDERFDEPKVGPGTSTYPANVR